MVHNFKLGAAVNVMNNTNLQNNPQNKISFSSQQIPPMNNQNNNNQPPSSN